MRIISVLCVLVLGLGLTLVLLTGLQVAHAGPIDLFVKAEGTGTACSRIMPCTIQWALTKAANGDNIYACHGKYTSTVKEVIVITKSVQLLGGWDGSTIGPVVRDPVHYVSVLDGQRERRVITISGDVTPTIDGFTITGGNATGLTTNCHSDADGCGGGIFSYLAHPIISNNIITDNIAAVTSAGPPTSTTGYGGGVYLNSATRAVIRNNLIISNTASTAYCGAGGGIYLYPYEGTLSGLRVQFNRVYSNTATTTNRSCAWGGGIHGGPDEVVIEGNTIAGNRANGWGGGQGAGLYQWFGSATYLNNLVTGNLGNVSDYAVYLGHSRSRFEGNRVVDNLTTQGIQLTISDGEGPELINNVVARSGGKAVVAMGYESAPLTARLIHNTLIGSGTEVGVSVDTRYVTLAMTNTIVTHFSIGIKNNFPAGSDLSADHTLFWNNADNGIQGTHHVHGNPLFGADGYHLLQGSAAINAGVNAGVNTDIDGDPRPIGPAFDIGADEFVPFRIYLPVILRIIVD
jgi:fibronectin-binding autotransporter adhesin